MTNKKIKELIIEIETTKPTNLQIKESRDNKPSAIHYYNSMELYTPDIVASYFYKKNFYVIEKEIRDSDISSLIFKWILFSAEARKTSGTFFLVLDKINSLKCKRIIANKRLEIEIIEL